MKKLVCSILIALVVVAVTAPGAVFAAQPVSTVLEVCNETGGAFSYPTFKPGQYATANIGFKLISDAQLAPGTMVKIDIATSTDLNLFPFDPELSTYEQEITANASGVLVFPFSMRVRGDAITDFYTIQFKIEYNNSTEYVDVNMLIDGSGSSGGGTGASTPRIIISNSSPQEVVAGENFTLSVTFKNTSTTTATSGAVKAQMSSADGTFSPVSGSTTIVLDAMAPGASVTKSILLTSKADAAPGSYTVTFSLSYDAPSASDPITDTEVLAIQVKQVPRAQVSKMQIIPSEVYVGNTINVMTSVNNTGKSTLYNVNVIFSDPNGLIEEYENFVGNIQSGSTGAVDVYLNTLMPGEANLTMRVTYEDENGTVYTHDESATLYIMEQMVNPGPVDPIEPPSEGGGLSTGWIVIIVLLVLAAALAAFLLIRKRKKQRDSLEDDRRVVDELEQQYLDEEAEQEADAEDIEQAEREKGDESATQEIDLKDKGASGKK